MKAPLMVLLWLLLPLPAWPDCDWPLWQQYKAAMMSKDGRIIDYSSPQAITTSEGQSYALFFALVANDKAAFERVLRWTQNNLAGGDLSTRLPAWQWGQGEDGDWRILDGNNAADSDLWIAYSLLEAGRLWQQPEYRRLGRELLWRSAAQSLRMMPGLGLGLLPGNTGFDKPRGWMLNPSYLPLPLLARFGGEAAVWQDLAISTRRLLLNTAPAGLAPDWVMWSVDGQSGLGEIGSYDAIRVYLWLGLSAPDTPGRDELLAHYTPMLAMTRQAGVPPERVNAVTGHTEGVGPAGFSAALLPMLAAIPGFEAEQARQRERLRTRPPAPEAYYDRSLLLFGLGWEEQRYRFDKKGRLLVPWEDSCE
ncbi:cellulose synthase complex periplasmic endoglucanase BcsZ [uncultured Oceanisphaera sp.]|uniref:cellulose synthase complex periplasmic endoglucanase BcsZ n=1 Tax=uncultured Oceanisphaera sp. TaxID=353858 RepID=UPI00262150BA|nr:cellulose synthase complex periplasmic endoglucanase BcsZ [uncultured Oceanisphaera sp.]